MTATHTEAAAFHAAILAAPLDDAPWLIYADWLDEQSTHEPAAKVRRWIGDVKPRAIEAWERGGDDDLVGAANTIQSIPGEWWKLAAVLGQWLTLERWPRDLSTVKWKKGWGSKRFDGTLCETRLVVEQFAFGLADRQQLDRAYSAAGSAALAEDREYSEYSVTWAADSVTRAADSMTRSAQHSAYSAARWAADSADSAAVFHECRRRFTALYRAVAEAVR